MGDVAPDFGGYATKANLKCTDGRTIMPEAFAHMNGVTVPLVWQHGHNSVDNVLGHAVLESRKDGVYAKGFFNSTKAGQTAKTLVGNGDVNSLSIYANRLVEKGKQVFHGMIKEVSLVLSGANPGAKIDFVAVQHADGEIQELEDEAVITTGLELEHAIHTYTTKTATTTTETMDGNVTATRSSSSESTRTMDDGTGMPVASDAAAYSEESEGEEEIKHAIAPDATIQQVYDSLTQEQKDVVNFMIGSALESAANPAMHSDSEGEEGSTEMGRNVFETNDGGKVEEQNYVLTHDDIKNIFKAAGTRGSLKDAVEDFALQHGIEDIDTLFPDAKALSGTPELNKRRTEWVADVLASTTHSPFARVKTIVADITLDDARAKGYVTGSLKKEEWVGLTKRTTSPTTVYKKQAIDRDDMVDITDFDVVAWLKAEMRLMLDEEIARAALIGDGRDVADADKIKDPIGAASGDGIRSILYDHPLFVTTVTVNLDDANSSMSEAVDGILDGMEFFKGTGTPTFYTTIRTLNKFLKLKDSLGRRIYSTKADVAAALGVRDVVTVEPMNDVSGLVGIIVNLADYNFGADRGGDVTMFDNFDIDYNRQKYLIETRLSGALTKIKSAIVVKASASTDVAVTPGTPTFVESTGVVTIPSTAHVVYKNAAGDTLSSGAQTALAAGASMTVRAYPASGYFLTVDALYEWTFKRPHA